MAPLDLLLRARKQDEMSGRRRKVKALPLTKEQRELHERKELEKERILGSIQKARDEVASGKRLISLGGILHIICSVGFSRETIVACSTCKELWDDDYHLQQIATMVHKKDYGGSMNRISFCIGPNNVGGARGGPSQPYYYGERVPRDALIAQRLQRLIAAGATVNRIGAGYNTFPPLCFAIGKGLTESVRILCAQPGLELNTKYSRRPPLVLAVAAIVRHHPQPNLEIVRILLRKEGLEVNALDEIDGSSALSIACLNAPADPVLVRILLESPDIDVNIGTPAPLVNAIKTANAAVFALLLGRPEIDPNTTGDFKPLVLAIESKNVPFLTVLLDQPNIDCNTISRAQVDIQRGYAHYGHLMTTPLMAACKNVDLVTVRLLCARADILVNTTTSNSTALILTCESFTSEPSRLELLQFLLEQPNLDINLRVGGKSALSAAAGAKDKGAFMLLMQQAGIVVRENCLNEACKEGAGGHGEVIVSLLAMPDLFPAEDQGSVPLFGGVMRAAGSPRSRALATAVSLSCINNHAGILSALLPLPDIVITRQDIMSTFRKCNVGVATLLTEWDGFASFKLSQAFLLQSYLYQQLETKWVGRVRFQLPTAASVEILKALTRRADWDVEASYEQAEHACLKGYHNAVAAFVAHPAFEINRTRASDGSTLVLIAAKNKLLEVVRVLVAVPGIDLNLPDFAGNSAIYYANLDTKGQTAVQTLLVSHGAQVDDAPDGRSRRGRILKAVNR